jgi:hypothetical protein
VPSALPCDGVFLQRKTMMGTTGRIKNCAQCGNEFRILNNYQKYCSRNCRRIVYRESGPESTDRQYKLISGNWSKYFNRLCSRSFGREGLNRGILLDLLSRQNGKCALSGVELTCVLQKGVSCKTNASIDRIDPKGGYVVGNVHLVCAALNKFRIDTPLDEFIDWCKKVADHAAQ